ncbi:hypothetical protein [uncultured Amphritea sp.]|uniref:hypothetical protein n=1 Tax=Amphritea sp. TaxID=1872502 RepID=UPI0025F472C9|nr:hypothetical protein [uncultured Amphritea sp.]
MLSWFRRFKKTELKYLIVIDTGYHSHQLSRALLKSGRYAMVAYIDEEPWNHLNLMNGARIHYPSELQALAEKHRVDVVIKFAGEGWQPDKGCLSALEKIRVKYICLEPGITQEDQFRIVAQQLSVDD